GQLALRLRDVRADARRVPRRAGYVPLRVVRGVDLHPDPCDLRDPNAPGSVLPEPPEPAAVDREPGDRGDRSGAAGFAPRQPPRLRPPLPALLSGPRPHGCLLPDARRAGEAVLLPHPRPPSAAGGPPPGPRPADPSPCLPVERAAGARDPQDLTACRRLACIPRRPSPVHEDEIGRRPR